MTIDEKIKQAAEGQSMRLTSSLIDADTRARIFTNGAKFLKSEMLADMQKLADALEYYNSLSDRVSVEYAYKDNTFCYSLVTDARLQTLAGQALAEFNVKYKEQK